MPRAAQTMASPMPVLPDVGSSTIVSGLILPASCAASIIAIADAVLDAVRRILEFQLAHDLRAHARGEAVDAYERRVADEFGDVLGDAHGATPVRVVGSSRQV